MSDCCVKATLLLLLSICSATQAGEPLSVHILDVGEGQAILLHRQTHGVLIDTGHAGKATLVLDRLDGLGVKTLDYLVLTHLHPDHASGFFRINEAYPSAYLLDNCQPLTATHQPDMMRWVYQAIELKKPRQCIGAKQLINWQGAELSFLWPLSQPRVGDAINHNSLVILVQYQNARLLIMGDADQIAEQEILKRFELPKVDVLVVGHHGSKHATSTAFLETVQPRHAVISINKNNFRGYPDPSTLEKLSRQAGQVHLTYAHGEISFKIDADGRTINTAGRRGP